MMVINAAYKVLKEPRTRAEYDRKKQSTSKVESSSRARPRPNGDVSRQRTYPGGKGTGYWAPPSPSMKESGESLMDIFSDVWSELKINGAVNLFEDLISYLDIQVELGST